MEVVWRETANQGRVPYLKEQDREIAHLPGQERAEALSLWEGIAGYAPFGRFAYWRWRLGLKRIERAIQGVSLSA